MFIRACTAYALIVLLHRGIKPLVMVLFVMINECGWQIRVITQTITGNKTVPGGIKRTNNKKRNKDGTQKPQKQKPVCEFAMHFVSFEGKNFPLTETK